MRSILYLDFDGVLHPQDVFYNREGRIYLSEEYRAQGHQLFESSSFLAEALQPYPGMDIVLSTSWSKVLGCERAARFLPPALSDRVVGCTFDPSTTSAATFDAMPRGFQVLADALRRGCERWLALDDDGHNWPKWELEKLVQTRPALGLRDPNVRELLKLKLSILTEEC